MQVEKICRLRTPPRMAYLLTMFKKSCGDAGGRAGGRTVTKKKLGHNSYTV